MDLNSQASESTIPSVVSLKLVTGVFFAALGILMTLENFDVVEATSVLRYWPLALIVAGLIRLTRSGDRVVALVPLAAGVLLLGSSLHLIRLSLFDLWPLALVVGGVVVVVQALGGRAAAESGELTNVWAVLSTRKVTSSSRSYRGGRIVGFMGGCQLDLTEAAIEQSPAVIEAMVIWGGINIRVPADWEVVAEAMPIMGGIDVKTKTSAGGKQLVVRGFSLMGGMQIKSVEARTI